MLQQEPEKPPRESPRYGVRIVEPILDDMGIAYHVIEDEADVGKIKPAIDEHTPSRKPVAFLIGRRPKHHDETRRLPSGVLARHMTDAAIVCGLLGRRLGRRSRPRVAQLHFHRRHGARLLSRRSGLALGRPDKRVIVLDGDGSLLMNLGSLVTIAEVAPKNLLHFVAQNDTYEANGSQPIPNRRSISPAWRAHPATRLATTFPI